MTDGDIARFGIFAVVGGILYYFATQASDKSITREEKRKQEELKAIFEHIEKDEIIEDRIKKRS